MTEATYCREERPRKEDGWTLLEVFVFDDTAHGTQSRSFPYFTPKEIWYARLGTPDRVETWIR